jgi:hypothetical protein
MLFIASIAMFIGGLGAFGALARKFGAEDRPGFDERRPLS